MCQQEDRCTFTSEETPPEKTVPALTEAPAKTRRRRQKPFQSKMKGKPIPPGASFIYYGRPTKAMSQKLGAFGHQGVMTVAKRIPFEDEGSFQVLWMGISFCSPQDPWCKVKGRDLAMTRLYDDPIVVPFLYEPHRIARQVAMALIRRDFKKLRYFGVKMPPTIERVVPGWAKNLAQRIQEGRLVSRPGYKRVSGISKLHKDPQVIDEIMRLFPPSYREEITAQENREAAKGMIENAFLTHKLWKVAHRPGTPLSPLPPLIRMVFDILKLDY